MVVTASAGEVASAVVVCGGAGVEVCRRGTTVAFPSSQFANSNETLFDSYSSSTLAAANVDGSLSVAGVKSETRLNNSVALAFGVVVVVSGSGWPIVQSGSYVSANGLGDQLGP